MAGRRDKRAKQARLQEVQLPSFAARRYFVLSLFLLAGLGLVWRAVDQQVLEKDFLQAEGADRYLDKVTLEAHRGLITDRNGEVLALSTPVDSVTANPRLLHVDDQALEALADALDVSTTALRKKLDLYRERRFVYLRRRLPPAQAQHVLEVARAHDLKGLHLEREYRRYYPTHEVFAHVVGFTNHADKGQEGLELTYEQDLSGQPGSKLVLRDGRRQVVDDVENIVSPRDGMNLALSLDGRLQYIAYRELKAAVRRNRALGGAAVLLDARTGEVLAMVSQPGYNPNGDRSSKGGRLRNRAITDAFEPGSMMKPFAVLAALDAGVVQANALIDTTPGVLKVGSAKVKDHHNLGRIDLATLLGKSSNVGAAKVALALDKADYWQFLDKLGFGHSPLTGFPAEASGILPFWRDWATIDQATLSFGYGLSASVLQLARAYTVLANDGQSVPISLLKQEAPAQAQQVVSKTAARQVREMLEQVVQPGGTGTLAAITGYRVAGKTGTAKKLGPNGYSDDRYQAGFAGVAPASDPRLVMVVLIDEPRGTEYYGGQVAGPVFSKVMGEALRLLNIAPDDLTQPQTRLAQLEGQPSW